MFKKLTEMFTNKNEVEFLAGELEYTRMLLKDKDLKIARLNNEISERKDDLEEENNKLKEEISYLNWRVPNLVNQVDEQDAKLSKVQDILISLINELQIKPKFIDKDTH